MAWCGVPVTSLKAQKRTSLMNSAGKSTTDRGAACLQLGCTHGETKEFSLLTMFAWRNKRVLA